MPRRKYHLGPNEARDGDGWIHKAIANGPLYASAACNGDAVGTNPDRLKGYCTACFPDWVEPKPRTRTQLKNHNLNLPSLDLDGIEQPQFEEIAQSTQPEIYCEELDETTVSQYMPVRRSIIKSKPQTTKSLDEILRKDKVTFKRRPIVTYNDYGRFLKKS